MSKVDVEQSHADSIPKDTRLRVGSVELVEVVFIITLIAGKLQSKPVSVIICRSV